MMVRLRKDYITRIHSEDLDTLTDDDWLYIQDNKGEHHLYEKSQVQVDKNNIMFIGDGMIHSLNYNDIKMYRVKEKPDNPLLLEVREISGFEHFMVGVLFGVCITCFLGMIV